MSSGLVAKREGEDALCLHVRDEELRRQRMSLGTFEDAEKEADEVLL